MAKRYRVRLTDKERQEIEGAFRLLQNRFLHGPISALAEDTHTEVAGKSGPCGKGRSRSDW